MVSFFPLSYSLFFILPLSWITAGFDLHIWAQPWCLTRRAPELPVDLALASIIFGTPVPVLYRGCLASYSHPGCVRCSILG